MPGGWWEEVPEFCQAVPGHATRHTKPRLWPQLPDSGTCLGPTMKPNG